MHLGNSLSNPPLWSQDSETPKGKALWNLCRLPAPGVLPGMSQALSNLLNQMELMGASVCHRAVTRANSGSWFELLSLLFQNSKPRVFQRQTTKAKSYREFVCGLLVQGSPQEWELGDNSPRCFRRDNHVKILFPLLSFAMIDFSQLFCFVMLSKNSFWSVSILAYLFDYISKGSIIFHRWWLKARF